MNSKKDNGIKNDLKRTPSWEHIFIYNKLKRKVKIGNFIRPSIIIEELRRVMKIPNTLHYPILKQMEEEGLIKRINHQKYEITEEEKDNRIKEINKKLKEISNIPYRNKRRRLLEVMEEEGLIRKSDKKNFILLDSVCDEKLESIGDYTFW